MRDEILWNPCVNSSYTGKKLKKKDAHTLEAVNSLNLTVNSWTKVKNSVGSPVSEKNALVSLLLAKYTWKTLNVDYTQNPRERRTIQQKNSAIGEKIH